MSALPAKSALPQSLEQQIELMERVLRNQLDGWRRVLGVIERQREAVRSTDGAALEIATREQQQLAKTLAMLDQQRERLALAMHRQVAPPVSEVKLMLPLTQLLQRVAIDDEQRTRLLALACDLRDTIAAAKLRGSIVRDAADTLNRHIAGIQQIVHSALSRAGVYGRRGKLAMGNATPASVDLKS